VAGSQRSAKSKKIMNKKIVSLELCTLLLAFNFPAEAQQPKAYLIGYLSGRGSSPPREFVQALHNIGYIEGKNITLDHRFANSKREPVPDLAAEMVPLKMDIIVAQGTGPTSVQRKPLPRFPSS
jgi:putative ABC transport system substrate-binding protein